MGAKPDLDDGWIKMAHELNAALALADFSKGARVVLNEAFSQIFGPAKLTSATLSPTKVAGDTGQKQPHISRAIRELVDSGVLLRKADGTYKFIKDYESWTYATGRGGAFKTPRLTSAEVVSCKNAPARALASKAYTQPGIASEIAYTQPGIASEIAYTQPGIKTIPNGVLNHTQPGIAVDPPPAPPLVNARGIENGELGELIPAPTPTAGGEDSVIPDTPTDLPGLIARVREELGDEWAAVVEGNKGDIAVTLKGRFDYYLAALRVASRSSRHIERPHSYAMTLAKKFLVAGIPAPSVAIEPGPGPARETTSQRKARELKEGFMRKHVEAQRKEREAGHGQG